MKKQRLLALILSIILILLPLSSATVEAAELPDVDATAYVVMDATDGEILLQKNSKKRIYPASTAKLLTAVTALDNAGTGRKIKTTQKVLDTIPSDSSQLFLPAGCTYKMGTYLNMLLISSSADAAVTLASGTCGSATKFIKKMNTTAKKIGMKNSHFDNPMGLDKGNGYNKTYSTAYDMALLSRYAMSYSPIRNIVSRETYKISASGKYKGTTLKNTNKLLANEDSTNSYTIIGTKTGSTRAAGKCLIATATDDAGHEVICAYFGATSSTNLYQGVDALLDYTFEECADNLSVNFFDTRYIKESKTILKYASSGILKGTAKGAFYPDKKMTEKTFSTLVASISGETLPFPGKDKEMTALKLAKYYVKSYTVSVSDTQLKKYQSLMKENTKNYSKLSSEEVTMLAAMYANKLLTSSYGYNVNATFTKAQTVTVGDKIVTFQSALQQQ